MIQAPQAIWSDDAFAVARAAQQAHDINWGRIANYDIGNDPNVDPALPDHHERNYILTVALIVTENIPGIVNLNGLPGGQNFDANVILAIMYYYRMKGWQRLREAFLQTVHEQMQGPPMQPRKSGYWLSLPMSMSHR